jgi:hypothetical protein
VGRETPVKALAQFGGIEHARLIHYLKATGPRVGLPLNSGAPLLRRKRFAFG